MYRSGRSIEMSPFVHCTMYMQKNLSNFVLALQVILGEGLRTGEDGEQEPQHRGHLPQQKLQVNQTYVIFEVFFQFLSKLSTRCLRRSLFCGLVSAEQTPEEA